MTGWDEYSLAKAQYPEALLGILEEEGLPPAVPPGHSVRLWGGCKLPQCALRLQRSAPAAGRENPPYLQHWVWVQPAEHHSPGVCRSLDVDGRDLCRHGLKQAPCGCRSTSKFPQVFGCQLAGSL